MIAAWRLEGRRLFGGCSRATDRDESERRPSTQPVSAFASAIPPRPLRVISSFASHLFASLTAPAVTVTGDEAAHGCPGSGREGTDASGSDCASLFFPFCHFSFRAERHAGRLGAPTSGVALLFACRVVGTHSCSAGVERALVCPACVRSGHQYLVLDGRGSADSRVERI